MPHDDTLADGNPVTDSDRIADSDVARADLRADLIARAVSNRRAVSERVRDAIALARANGDDRADAGTCLDVWAALDAVRGHAAPAGRGRLHGRPGAGRAAARGAARLAVAEAVK